MKILVTGFDPFGGEKINPAFEAVKLIPDCIEGAKIIKLEVPTVFKKGPQATIDGLKNIIQIMYSVSVKLEGAHK